LDKIFFFHLRFTTTFSLSWIRSAVSARGAFFSEGFKKEFFCGWEGGDYRDLTVYLWVLAVGVVWLLELLTLNKKLKRRLNYV
jgi:hypothetical protein